MKACVALGGTITGEHGIGTEKSAAMRLICSEDELEFQRALRTAFDPTNLLNPGKIFPSRAEGEAPPEPTDEQYRDKAELVPADVDDACAMVRSAYRDGVSLLPLGAATRPDFGNRSDRTFVRLRSTSLADVVEYDPANQTIAVGAGMSVIGLQDVLAERKQWLPIRPPLGNDGTVGGLVATAACGPERLRYGGPRDLLLGLKFVSGTGRLIAAGGRVVKNVAGYDVTRLLVGSAGTLGLLTELTFRVVSLPECRRALSAVGALDACQAAVRELLCSKLEPTLVVAAPVASSASETSRWQLTAGFEGFEETVDFQQRGTRAIFEQATLDVRGSEQYAPLEGPCVKSFASLRESPFLLRADVPLDKVLCFATGQANGMDGGDRDVLVDFGCGRITVGLSSLEPRSWKQFALAADALGGHAVLEQAPEEFRANEEVFGQPQPAWRLMHTIKSILDPGNVLAPGRLPDGKK